MYNVKNMDFCKTLQIYTFFTIYQLKKSINLFAVSHNNAFFVNKIDF